MLTHIVLKAELTLAVLLELFRYLSSNILTRFLKDELFADHCISSMSDNKALAVSLLNEDKCLSCGTIAR